MMMEEEEEEEKVGEYWLEAAGGRDDVNPGVDRLRCSAPCGHLVHSRTQCTTNRPPSAVLLRLTDAQCNVHCALIIEHCAIYTQHRPLIIRY